MMVDISPAWIRKSWKVSDASVLLDMENRATDPGMGLDYTDERQLSLRRHNIQGACRGPMGQGEVAGSS